MSDFCWWLLHASNPLRSFWFCQSHESFSHGGSCRGHKPSLHLHRYGEDCFQNGLSGMRLITSPASSQSLADPTPISLSCFFPQGSSFHNGSSHPPPACEKAKSQLRTFLPSSVWPVPHLDQASSRLWPRGSCVCALRVFFTLSDSDLGSKMASKVSKPRGGCSDLSTSYLGGDPCNSVVSRNSSIKLKRQLQSKRVFIN